MRALPTAALTAALLAAAPALAAPPIFENSTPAGFSPVDGGARTTFVTGNEVFVRVDLNQAATAEHPVVGDFHALERSEQLSGLDTDGLQIDIAMVDVAPFSTGDNLPAPGVTQAASASPAIHVAWVEQTGYSAGTVYSGGITPVYQVKYAHSYDLGRTFSAAVSVSGSITYHPLTALANGPFASLDLEVDSGGHPRVTYAFISTADRSRRGNVYLAYSHDDGELWETPLVVNDLATNGNREGRHCGFPRLAIDDRDNIFVTYVRGVSAGGGTEDVMLARVDRTAAPFTMVAVGSLGTAGSSGGVRLTPDAGRQTGPDLAVGDGDALHVIYFSDDDDQVQHKRLATDLTWARTGADGWDQDVDGAAVGSFVDELANAALEQVARYVFPTLAVDRQHLPDRVYGLYKGGSGTAESIYFNHYDDDGAQGPGAAWGAASPVWSTGGTPLFRDGDLAYAVELDWTVTERVAAVVDRRLEDRGDLHIAFTAGYSNTAAGGEHDVYYATYNGASWSLPEKVADDDSDGAGTEDGIAAGDGYLL
ncbi:MAG: sialidase family protein, partial [Gemmatimonadota bacterium]